MFETIVELEALRLSFLLLPTTCAALASSSSNLKTGGWLGFPSLSTRILADVEVSDATVSKGGSRVQKLWFSGIHFRRRLALAPTRYPWWALFEPNRMRLLEQF